MDVFLLDKGDVAMVVLALGDLAVEGEAAIDLARAQSVGQQLQQRALSAT
jgi:hypothetical protein